MYISWPKLFTLCCYLVAKTSRTVSTIWKPLCFVWQRRGIMACRLLAVVVFSQSAIAQFVCVLPIWLRGIGVMIYSVSGLQCQWKLCYANGDLATRRLAWRGLQQLCRCVRDRINLAEAGQQMTIWARSAAPGVCSHNFRHLPPTIMHTLICMFFYVLHMLKIIVFVRMFPEINQSMHIQLLLVSFSHCCRKSAPNSQAAEFGDTNDVQQYKLVL